MTITSKEFEEIFTSVLDEGKRCCGMDDDAHARECALCAIASSLRASRDFRLAIIAAMQGMNEGDPQMMISIMAIMVRVGSCWEAGREHCATGRAG